MGAMFYKLNIFLFNHTAFCRLCFIVLLSIFFKSNFVVFADEPCEQILDKEKNLHKNEMAIAAVLITFFLWVAVEASKITFDVSGEVIVPESSGLITTFLVESLGYFFSPVSSEFVSLTVSLISNIANEVVTEVVTIDWTDVRERAFDGLVQLVKNANIQDWDELKLAAFKNHYIQSLINDLQYVDDSMFTEAYTKVKRHVLYFTIIIDLLRQDPYSYSTSLEDLHFEYNGVVSTLKNLISNFDDLTLTELCEVNNLNV